MIRQQHPPGPWWRRLARSGGSDDGSAQPALELILVTPAILLIILVGVATGRLDTGQSRVHQAAAAGARAATGEHTPSSARATAERVVSETLKTQGVDCTEHTTVVDTDQMSFPAGTPAAITVTVTCHITLTGLDIAGWPAGSTVTATAASPLDPRREQP